MDAGQVSRRARLGIAFRLCVFVLKPILTLTTKRTWTGVDQLRTHSGIVVAANHLSWVDPLIVSHILWNNDRPPRFLAKDSLFDTPVVGWILRNAHQIPVFRGTPDAATAVGAAVAAARAGECVVVYPEGTITKDPKLWPGPAKSGAARIALTADCPLIPMAQWGSQNIMAPYRKKLKLLPPKKIEIRFGAPVDLKDLRGLPITADVLEQATDRLMAAIGDLLTDIRAEQVLDQAAPTEEK